MSAYAEVVDRLDLDYIRRTGESIAARLFPDPALRDGEVVRPAALPVAFGYEPDNATRYQLIFVPVSSLQQAGMAGDDIPIGVDFDFASRWTVVAMIHETNGFAYPFELQFGTMQHADYVARHTGLNYPDAAAITALLRAISGTNPTEAD